MDREAADDEVEGAEGVDRLAEIPRSNLDTRVVRKACPRAFQHRRRHVDGDDLLDIGAGIEDHRGQPAVATSEVERALRCRRHDLGQHHLAGQPLRHRADSTHVLVDLVRAAPAGHRPRLPRVHASRGTRLRQRCCSRETPSCPDTRQNRGPAVSTATSIPARREDLDEATRRSRMVDDRELPAVVQRRASSSDGGSTSAVLSTQHTTPPGRSASATVRRNRSMRSSGTLQSQKPKTHASHTPSAASRRGRLCRR